MSNLPNLWRRNPLWTNSGLSRELSRFQDEADRFFKDFMAPISMDSDLMTKNIPAFSPACDVEEKEGHYLLTLDVPGMKKDEIKIEVRDNQLHVSGERKEEKEEKGKNRYRSERFYGSFERSFALPAGIKADQVEADYQDGVLKIAVPKAEATKVQQVKISEGKPSVFQKILGKKEETKGDNGRKPVDKIA